MLIIAKMKAKEASISRIVLEMWINQGQLLLSGINYHIFETSAENFYTLLKAVRII